MASEMVERVARAILAKCEEFESRRGDLMEFDSRELARAAIAAMREPTEAIVSAHHIVPDDNDFYDRAAINWRNLIDVALK